MTTGADLPGPATSEVQRIREHLLRSGWRLDDQDSRTSAWRWQLDSDDERRSDVVVVLPNDDRLADDAYLTDALRAVAYVEDRSVKELQTDLAVVGGADTVSVRLTPEAPSGSAPLATVQTAMNALHDLVVGAASGLVIRDLVLPARRPLRAESYAAQALVSTEPGSFIVNLALPRLENEPVPTRIDDASPTLVDLPPQPYGRQVLNRLRQVVQRSVSLADAVGAGERPIREFGIPTTTSANATELAALSLLGGADRGRYQIRFTQAPEQSGWVRPLKVVVTPAQQATLADAALFLRERQPRTGVTVVGLVVRLSRDRHIGPGEITVQGVSDDSGSQRRFRMELSEPDYNEAVRAHTTGLQVMAAGDIEVSGTRSSLRRLTGFNVMPGLDD